MYFIEEERMSADFTKFHLREFPFYGVFHRFEAPDPGGDPHDHPFPFTSLVVKRWYIERIWNLSDGSFKDVKRSQGDYFKVEAGMIHQIIELPEGECWTYMTPGLHEREWGFYRFLPDRILHRFHYENDFKLFR